MGIQFRLLTPTGRLGHGLVAADAAQFLEIERVIVEARVRT